MVVRQPEPVRFFAYDKHGHEYEFFYFIDDSSSDNPLDWTVFVSTKQDWPPAGDRWYEMSLNRVDECTIQTINMRNHRLPEYMGKGISEALIPEMARVLKADIVSSPGYVDNANRRSDSATVIWERLVANGIALKLASDQYVVPQKLAANQPRRR